MNGRSINLTRDKDGTGKERHDVQRGDEVRSGRGCKRVARDGASLGAGARQADGGADRPRQHLSARALARAGRTGPSGHHRARGIWRCRDGLSGPCHRGRGDCARLGLGLAQLRGAFQSLRQPDQAQRLVRAEGEIPAGAGLGRACRRACHVRGGGRQRRGLDEPARRAAQRSLPAQRQQILDHQRAGCRYARGLCQDRPGGGKPGHHGVPDREDDEGFLDLAAFRQAGDARLQHRRAGLRGCRGAVRECAGRGGARRARAHVRP